VLWLQSQWYMYFMSVITKCKSELGQKLLTLVNYSKLRVSYSQKSFAECCQGLGKCVARLTSSTYLVFAGFEKEN